MARKHLEHGLEVSKHEVICALRAFGYRLPATNVELHATGNGSTFTLKWHETKPAYAEKIAKAQLHPDDCPV